MSTGTTSWRIAWTRGTAALMAISVVLTLRPAHGSPGDIFSLPAPVIGADPPKAAELRVGDVSVSTQTGALSFNFAIQVPPGRSGMAPSVQLSYSSQAPIYGGVASGWSLPIQLISEDHSSGRLATRSEDVEYQQLVQAIDPKADDRFMSSLAGGRPLIAVIEPGITMASGVYKTYRAANDSSWTRYERMDSMQSFRWRALTTDGVVMRFGDAARTTGCLISDQHAPLTSSTDRFGNEISYHYVMSAGECMLEKIRYGQNGSLPMFAEIDIDFHPAPLCNGVPIGSQLDYRTGKKIVTGANQIEAINAYAIDPGTSAIVHTLQITLAYDPATAVCSSTLAHAPVRQLRSIQESAWGVDSPRVDLPAVAFDYNTATTTLAIPSPEPIGTPWGAEPKVETRESLGWGYRREDDRWPTVESMLVDLDGDGLQDLLTNTSVVAGAITTCKAEWRRNTGPNPASGTQNGHPQFSSTATPITLPRLKWGGTNNPSGGAASAAQGFPQREGCSLNGQATVYENSDPGTLCHINDLPCVTGSSPDPNNPGPYCYAGGTECPSGGDGSSGVYRTYLAYRWLDADSDGLTDLVTAVHGDIERYDIEFGNLPGYDAGEPAISGIPAANAWPACPGTTDRCKKFDDCLDDRIVRTCNASGCTINWSIVAGCVAQTPTVGCEQVMAKVATQPDGTPPPTIATTRKPYQRCEGLYPWFIYRNVGNGTFAPATVKYQPVPLESASGDSNFSGPVIASESRAIMDFDGDGWQDAIVRDTEPDGDGSLFWQVFRGDGTGGFTGKSYRVPTRPINCAGLPCPGDNAISGVGGVWGLTAESSRGLTDFNGDGLADHLCCAPPS